MDTTTFTPSPIYAGEFRHAVDPKGRVTVPAKWRRSEQEDLYVIPNQKNEYLIIMPPEEFKAIGEKMATSEKVEEAKKRTFLRNFFSQAQPVTVDRQGRMLLPEDYCKRVQITDEVIIAGGNVRFEIWNPDRWDRNLKEQQNEYCEMADSIGL